MPDEYARGARKGTKGVSTNAVAANFRFLTRVTEGPLGYSR